MDEHPLPIREAPSSFATLSAQLLSSNFYTAPTDGGYYNDDDMDCSPLSPMLLTDVDMEILTDTPPTPPSWAQWNAEYLPMPPYHHNTFSPIWQTAVPPSGTWHSPGFAPMTVPAASFHAHWDVANVSAPPGPPHLLPYTYPLCILGAVNDPIQDTTEVHWEQPPHLAGASQPTSVATLVNAFERSLTLVMPSSGADTRNDPKRDCEPAPVHVIEDPLRTNDSVMPPATLEPAHANDRPDDSLFVQREATDPLGDELDKSLAYFLNLLDIPLERESTTPPEQNKNKDQTPQPFEREATEPLKQDEDQLLASLPDLADSTSLATPRPPTPPPSRRLTRRDTHLALVTTTDHAELPVAQASVQAGKGAQPHPHQGAAWVPRPPPSRARVAGDDDDEEVGGTGSARGPTRRTALGLVSRTPPTTRRPKKPKGVEEVRRVRTKRTRFVEDEGEEDGVTSLAVRLRRTGSNEESKRPNGPGPVRSILRNKHAMPYDKTTARHAGRRRASVP